MPRLKPKLDAVLEAMRMGDETLFRLALACALEGRDLRHWARQTGIPLRTLYRIRNGEGGARFDNVLRLLKDLNRENA